MINSTKNTSTIFGTRLGWKANAQIIPLKGLPCFLVISRLLETGGLTKSPVAANKS
jgi:hypothetical protein